jgi:hypothetical protein
MMNTLGFSGEALMGTHACISFKAVKRIAELL